VSRSILVTDGDERSALAVVRSLGSAGHDVYVCSSSGRSIAGASRHAKGERIVAASLASPREFAHDVKALISTWGIDTLLPMTEQAFNAIFANSALFTDVVIPGPTSEQFRAISDKQRVMEAALACGLGVPAQIVLSTPSDAEALTGADLDFPLVVKPARSVAQKNGVQIKLGVIHCPDREALRSALDSFPAAAYPLLLQHRIIGPGIGVFLLMWGREMVASFAHRRLREKPPSGGVSVYRESIEPDPDLLERSRKLLERFNWSGVAMIEYKVEQKTGIPFIMEINGRFWGSLQLAIDAGVDFPRLLLECASGQKVSGPEKYKLGIRSKWEWGEVDYILARLRRTDAELSLPPGSLSRLRGVLRPLIPWLPGDRFEVLRASDPAPFFRETLRYFGGR
jgi:predicted ATP-grasp superfamily ATP-dependent carboligase